MARRNDNLEPQPAPALTAEELLAGQLGSYTSIYVPQYRLAQYNPDLLTTQKGYDIFETMLTMAACRAPLNIKRYAVLHKGWTVLPAVTDPTDSRHAAAKELADATSWALSNILDPATDEPQDFRSVLFELLLGCWMGFGITEIIWRTLDTGPYKGKLGFKRFAAKPCKQIGFELDPETLGVIAIRPYTIQGGYGSPVAPAKVLRFTYNPVHGLPYGMGDGRSAYKHWWRLDATLKVWGMALERFGSPFILAKYPQGNAQVMTSTIEALDKIRQGAPAVLPDKAEANVVSAAAGGALDVFRSAADWDTQQVARAVLGSTLTSGEGARTGSLALGNVHQDTQQIGLEFTKTELEGVITQQLIRRFIRYNFGDAALDLCPRLSLGEWDATDREKLARMFSTLIKDKAIAPRAKFIREELGLPPMDEEEEAMLDASEQMEREAQARVADARNTAPGASGTGGAVEDDTEEDDGDTD